MINIDGVTVSVLPGAKSETLTDPPPAGSVGAFPAPPKAPTTLTVPTADLNSTPSTSALAITPFTTKTLGFCTLNIITPTKVANIKQVRGTVYTSGGNCDDLDYNVLSNTTYSAPTDSGGWTQRGQSTNDGFGVVTAPVQTACTGSAWWKTYGLGEQEFLPTGEQFNTDGNSAASVVAC
jgi:hypothetical protein